VSPVRRITVQIADVPDHCGKRAPCIRHDFRAINIGRQERAADRQQNTGAAACHGTDLRVETGSSCCDAGQPFIKGAMRVSESLCRPADQMQVR